MRKSKKDSRSPSKVGADKSSKLDKPVLSIIVCSYEGGKRIGDCLDALTKQSIKSSIEIIVVDDGSKDATSFIAKATLENKGIRYKVVTFPDNLGLSAARNAGVAESSAAIIAFTDDDCIPNPKWAERLMYSWSQVSANVHGIGGLVRAFSTSTYNRRYLDVSEPLRPIELEAGSRSIFSRLREYFFPQIFKGERNVDSFVGANMSFRRSSIDSIKGFDSKIKFGGDEQYLCNQLRARFGDNSLLLDPELIIDHEFHSEFKDTLRRAHAYGSGNGRNWVRDGGFPSLLPGPSLFAFGGILSYIVSPKYVLPFLLIFFTLLGHHLIKSAVIMMRRRDVNFGLIIEIFSYPFVRLLTEILDNIGFIQSVHSNSTGRIAYKGWLWLGLGCFATLFDFGWPGKIVILFTYILLPGSAILSLIRYNPSDYAARLLSASAVGLSFSMSVGLLASWFGPLIGVERPLDKVPVSFTSLFIGIGLLILTGRGRDPYTWLIGGKSNAFSLRWLLLLLLPIWSVLAALRLNNNGSGESAYILTLVITALLVVTVLRTWSRDHNWPVEAIIISVSLALAWSTTLRGYGLFGWDIQKELGIGRFTVDNGIWSIPDNGDAYASMLSLTVLPAQFSALAGVSVESTLRWVFPVFLAITAGGILAAARRRANPGPAILALLLAFVATPSFARQIPAIGRQEVAFLLIASLLLAVSDHTASLRSRRLLALISGVGLAYSHYTSAYVTSFFLVVVLLVSPFLERHTLSCKRVLSFFVCIGIISSTFLWNGVITRPGTELTEAQITLTDTGVRMLDNEESNFIKSWLVGTGVQRSTFDKYRESITERRDRLGWVVPDPKASKTLYYDDNAPVDKGLVSELKGAWYLGTALLRQLVTLIIVVALFWYLRRIWLRHTEFDPEIFALGLGAFSIAALLRLSSTAAELYNPERAAVHAGLVFSLILGTFFSRHLNRISVPSIAALLLLVGAWGLSVPVFGGSPLVSHSNIGEDAERYITTPADNATAEWLASSLPYSANVHTDRYGRVVLLSREFGDKFTIIDVVDPVGVDRDGYVFFTSMNRSSLRARGQVGDDFSIFTTPEPFFANTRSIVYASEVTRVYR